MLRAIGTIRDLDEMALDIMLPPTAARSPVLEAKALSPLFQFRGVGVATLLEPCREEKYTTELPAAMMRRWSLSYIKAIVLSLSASGTNSYFAADWVGSSDNLAALLAFFCDLQRLAPDYCSDRDIRAVLKLRDGPVAVYLAWAKWMLGHFTV